jgi:hypothetical protein
MPEIGMSGLMSGDRKRSVAIWPKPPRACPRLYTGLEVRMKRRNFITLMGGVAAWPLVGYAQEPKVRRVGALLS